MTRKNEVLLALRGAGGGWVDGSSLATAEVGGSEGLKRLRELRAEGWPIEERRHPDPRRAIWQYRLGSRASASGHIPAMTPAPRDDLNPAERERRAIWGD